MSMRSLPLLLAASALLVACPSDDDDSAPPIDDDDSAAIDDDDSATADDDDATPPAPWPTLEEARITFVGGSADLGAVMETGDFDQDGVPDVVLGVPEDPVDDASGRVYIFFGSSLRAAAVGAELDVSEADAIITGEVVGGKVGISLAVGDLNGDGADDLAVGADAIPETYIFEAAQIAVGGEILPSTAGFRVTDQVAECVRWMGDVDGDGSSELIISNTVNSTAGNVAGRSYLISGEALLATGDVSAFAAWADFPGAGPGESSGCESGPAGDLDGDGLAEIMIGTQGNSQGGGPNAGKVSLFGGATLVANEGGTTALASADVIFLGEAGDDRLGSDVRSIGDIDDDGVPDFVLSSRNNDDGASNAGKTYIVRGSQVTFGQSYIVSASPALLGEAETDRSGSSVAAMGDVDGDGVPDIAIGAPRNDALGEDAGTVYIASGALVANGGAFPIAFAGGLVRGVGVEDRFGDEVVGLGDLDGDGLGDLLAGAPGHNAPGKAYILLSPW